MSFNKQHAIDVLNYWHLIEFFSCIDLRSLVNYQKGVIHYDQALLSNDPNGLPWLNREHIRRAGADYFPEQPYAYSLYLGIFKNSEFFDQASAYFGNIDNPDWNERKSDGGFTCAMKIDVSKDGVLLLDTLELATAPWALGQVLNGNIDAFRYDDFLEANAQFLRKLESLAKLTANLKQTVGVSEALTPFEIIEILKLLGDWAGFIPQGNAPLMIIKLRRLHNESAAPRDLALPPNAAEQLAQLAVHFEASLATELAPETQRDATRQNTHEPPPITDAKNVAILNSFLLRDIERARELIQHDKLDSASPLLRYLSNSNTRYPDLLKSEGELTLRTNIALKNTPWGRWPSDTKHSMSLMQQFALNTLQHELRDQGLFSVNGPPGTGKTTLLRDLVADNVVKRARVLAKLRQAQDAFAGEIVVKIGSSHKKGIKRLIPELLGHEMLVVSCNNTAVENIAKELPRKNAIGAEFEHASYLQPVAQKLAAEHHNNTLYPLEPGEECWALVAAPLGKLENRKAFANKIQFLTTAKLNHVDSTSQSYSTLVPAIKQLIESTGDVNKAFGDAQKQFLAAEKAVKSCLDEMRLLEDLSRSQRERAGHMLHSSRLRQRKARTARFLGKIKDSKPSLFNFKKYARRSALIKAFELRLTERRAEAEQGAAQLASFDAAMQHLKSQGRILQKKYADVLFDYTVTDIENEGVQKRGIGHGQALNKARSELTIAAFHLHQAWLVACYEHGFDKNINSLAGLVEGKIRDYEEAKVVWQSLFMVVPVVSSTFASLANQFAGLHEGDIGWVLIDEAGQATPQQAVGALLRGRRVIAVGDPQQIEPVFSAPPEFIDYFGKKLLGEDWHAWSATADESVQTLADRANPYGTELITETWLGSPLRVHRRCQEPMFGIANHIAYNNKMIHGTEKAGENSAFLWGESCWFDVEGEVQGKHYVPQQGELVLQLLNRSLEREGQLPDCYLISPFKDVVNRLQYFLQGNLQHPDLDNQQLRQWLSDRVGTVHTFQGKEERSVILVLGGSSETQGAIAWASEKPNILNVAVTRAKHRLFIIGSRELWGSLKYFSVAAEQLITRKVVRAAEPA